MKKRQDFSPNSIGFYLNCPKQYYFEYLDNYTSAYPNKQKIKQIQVEAGRRKELIFGGLLHNILSIFFHLPEAERNEEKLLALLKEVWSGPRSKACGFPKLEEEREWYQEALDILRRFAQTQNLFPDISYLPEIEKEDEFVKANLLKVPLQQGELDLPGVTLTGKIDRIDKEEKGYHLIDYKTGKSEGNDEFQLMAYSILAEEALGKPPTKASYLYLRTSNLKSFEPTEETKARTKERVLEIAKQIQGDEQFSPNPTKLCSWCDYVEFCPAKEEAKKLIAEYKGEDELAELPF